jgi:hypothetical protein
MAARPQLEESGIGNNRDEKSDDAPLKYQGMAQTYSLIFCQRLFEVADENHVRRDEAACGGELFAVR